MEADTATQALLASREDPVAFQTVFDAHHAAIRRFLRAQARDPLVAEDLAAETFARAFAARARFKAGPGMSARAWLYAIARNLLRDHARSNQRSARLIQRMRGERPPDQSMREMADPALGAAMAALSENERDVLLLFAWAELSYEEIAVATGVRVGTVRSRLHRAREHLRVALSTPPATSASTVVNTADGECGA